MANVSQIKKVSRTILASDPTIIDVPVLWDSPFNDTNYAVSCTLEVQKGLFTSYTVDSIHGMTRTGFLVNIFTQGSVGDVIVLHCMASHK